MRRAPLFLAVPIALVLALTACGAPAPSESGSRSPSATASRTPSPTASATATATPAPDESAPAESEPVDPGPDGPPQPIPSTDPASLDWFGLDRNAVTSSCQTALAENFPGGSIDPAPSTSGRSEETVVWFNWIVRAYGDAPDFAATCQLGLDGTSITSVFVTVQDI